MRYFRCLLFLLVAAQTQLHAADELFDIKPVAEGVYAAIAKPSFRTNCNAAIVILENGVIVVDSESKPSAAKALIEQIKRLTDKPVRYLVITHFHGDHFQGAEAYMKAWPSGVQIISSEATRESIENRGIARMKREFVTVPQQIEKMHTELDKTTDEKEKLQIGERIRNAEAYLAELKQTTVVLPTLTFERRLTLHDTSRTVQILWLGKAHTDGDAFVYLPEEKVIITGDVLHGLAPTMADSSPYDWIHTLKALQVLDFDYAIGGHGGVLTGKGTLELWESYFTDLLAATAQGVGEGATLEEVKRRVVPMLQVKYGERFPVTFAQSVIANVDTAYKVVSAQTQ